MKTESIITQKVSDLSMEVRSGVKRVRTLVKAPMVAPIDAVAISNVGAMASKIAGELNGSADPRRAEQLEELRGKIAGGEYTITDELVEEIAMRILKMLI